ncbi:MAG: Hpt domain-containing protein, partial [Gammaproteobacteria bacterium]|nr:Hpt domain-containing protein [Gammaproteobacteria bacterium]
YSRDVTVMDVLDQTPAYLDQVQGALDILGQRRAAEMVAVGSQSIRDIHAGKLEPTPEVIDALAVAVGSAEAYVSGLEQGRQNIGTLIDRAMREMHASISGRRISHIEVATVLAEMHTQLDAWLEDAADGPAFRGLRQGLRDIAVVADTRDEVRIGRIVAEVNNLLDIVSDDVGFLGEEIEAMLRRSLQTLTDLCARFDTRPADAMKPAVVEAADGDTGIEADDDGISQDEIMQIFLEETREALPAIDRLHGEWRADKHQDGALVDLRRYFHTLKGSGRLAGASTIAELSWFVENVLNKVIAGFLQADEALHRFVSDATNALERLVAGDDAIDLETWRRGADELLSTDGATMAAAPDDADTESLDDTVVRIFVSETLGHLRVIRDHVESGREAGECLVTDDLVRSAHTLQGSARSMGLEQMSNASASLDRVLQVLLSRDASLDAGDLKRLDDLHGLIARTIDRLNQDPSVPEDLDAEFAAIATEFEARYAAVDAAPDVVDEDLEMRRVFKEEAVDILSRVNRTITSCQSQGVDQSRLNDLRRELHTLKGGALAANVQAVADVSHHTESLLEHLSASTSILEVPLLALLEEVHDSLSMAIDTDDASTTRSELTALSSRIMASASSMQAAADTAQPAIAADPALPVPTPAVTAHSVAGETPDLGTAPRSIATDAGPDQVRVGIDTLDTLVNFVGEVSVSRSRLQEQLLEAKENLRELRTNVTRFKDQLRELEIEAESRISSRASARDNNLPEADFDPLEFDRYTRMQTLSRSMSESLDDLVAIQSGLDQFASVADTMLQHQAQITSQLQDGLIRTRMVSFATQVPWLRHIVRQTARELNKQADLTVSGADVEIDRNVLEPLLGPLEHMIRNAVAHGIEPVEQRTRIGKPSMAQIEVACREDDGEVIIDFSDDGAGLDFDSIRARARAAGLAAGAEIADDEIIQLLVMPGVSTAAAVTQLSGRGVGMDVVNNAVRRLGGSITVRSERGRGATFSIRVPVNLSITHA